MPVQAVERLTLTCAECGATFRRYPSQIKAGQQYCSKKCVGAAKRHGSELFCAMCDTAFYRRFGEQDQGVKARQFCSRACYDDWRTLHRSRNTYIKVGARHLHRVIAEQALGRALLPDEVVHHKDGDKHNNELTNLVVFPNAVYHGRCHKGLLSEEEIARYALVS